MPHFEPETDLDDLPNVGVIYWEDLPAYQQRRLTALKRTKTRPCDDGGTTCTGWAFTTRLKPLHSRRIGFRRP